ncbi:uncharacterized protein ACBT57_024436 [Dama dama]
MGSSLGAGDRAALGRLALLWALVAPGIQQDLRVLQPSVMAGHAGRAVTMSCRVSRSVDYVHWFRQLEGQAPERLLYLALSKRDVQWDSVLRGDKVSAARGADGKSCTMSLMKLAKSDEGVYYCAAWRSAQRGAQPRGLHKMLRDPLLAQTWPLPPPPGPLGPPGVISQYPDDSPHSRASADKIWWELKLTRVKSCADGGDFSKHRPVQLVCSIWRKIWAAQSTSY